MLSKKNYEMLTKNTKIVWALITLTVLINIVFYISPAYASESDLSFVSLLKFSAGIVMGFSIHEGAHLLAAELTDTEMDWNTGDHNQPLAFKENSNSDFDGLVVNSAGLISQAIGSEIILQYDRIDKNDYFVRGIMAWNILNPILYSLDYWFIGRTNKINGNMYQGDIAGIEHYSSKRTANIFALSITAIAAFQGYRFLKTQSWAPHWLKGKSHSINFVALPSEGLIIINKFYF